MHITVTPRLTALAYVVLAGQKEDDAAGALCAFYLLALTKKLGLPTGTLNIVQLASSMFEAAGSPVYAKPVLKLLLSDKVKKSTDLSSLQTKFLPQEFHKLARSILKTVSVNDEAFREVTREAFRAQNPKLSSIWRPVPVKPVARDPAEKAKQTTRYLKDLLIAEVRGGTPLPEILKTLDEEAGKPSPGFSKLFPPKLLKRLTVNETGGLLFDNEPLVSRAGSPTTLWTVKGAQTLNEGDYTDKHSYRFGYTPAQGIGVQKVYLLSSVQKANTKKWGAVDKLTKYLPKVKKAWMELLKKGDPLGAAIHFSYLTSARVGGSSTDPNSGLGTTTLRFEHVRILPSGNIKINYNGKKGVAQEHTLVANVETTPLISWIKKRLASGLGKKTILFSNTNVPISNGTINTFLKGYIPGVTVHKFRHLRGSTLALTVLAATKVPANITQAKANALFKLKMEQVGKALGHYNTRGDDVKVTAMTAIKNYIPPTICRNWFTNLGLQVPNFIEAA